MGVIYDPLLAKLRTTDGGGGGLTPPVAVDDLAPGLDGTSLITIDGVAEWVGALFDNPISATSGLAGVHVDWSVTVQLGLSVYSVQQSSDGITGWVQVGSAPFNEGSLDYQTNISTPVGTVYFRVQAIASDGTTLIQTSDVISFTP